MKNKMLVLTLLFALVVGIGFALTYPTTTPSTTTSTDSGTSPLSWSGYVTTNQSTPANQTVVVTPSPHAPPVQRPGAPNGNMHAQVNKYRHKVMNQSCAGDMCTFNKTHHMEMNMTPREMLRHKYAHMVMKQIHEMKHTFISSMNKTIHQFNKYRNAYKKWAMVREMYQKNKTAYEPQYLNATKQLILRAINTSMVQLEQVNATDADRIAAQNAINSLRTLRKMVEECKDISCIRSKYKLIRARIQSNNQLYAYDRYQKIAGIYLAYAAKYENVTAVQAQIQEIENELTQLMTNMQGMSTSQVRMKLAQIRAQLIKIMRQVPMPEPEQTAVAQTNTTTSQ